MTGIDEHGIRWEEAECRHSRGWTAQELRSLIETYESGAEIEILASEFSTGIKDIWHRLSWLYFGESCPDGGTTERNHGARWEFVDDNQLVKLHTEGVPVRRIALELGRSPQAICLRLLENWWARIPRQTIEKLGLNPEDF